jgi:sec-independent protein translocase protein TatC
MADSSDNGFDGLAEGPEGDQPMSFFDHLAELRSRLMRAAIGVMVGFGGAFFFVDYLEGILLLPLSDAWRELGLEGVPKLQNLGMLDSFLTDVRIALTFGLFFAGPIVFYQLWMFIAPGLYDKEKHLAVPFMATSAVMFVSGAAFCYYLVFPFATQWFLEYSMRDASGPGGVEIVAQFTFSDFMKYATRLLLAFGAVFEFPLAIFFLARAGIVTHLTLLRYWKISVLFIFVVSAFLTPPDPITLTLMAVPLTAMFFASVGVAYLVGRKHVEEAARLERELAEFEDDEDDQGP